MTAFLWLSDQPQPHRCSRAWCITCWSHRWMIREHVCPSLAAGRYKSRAAWLAETAAFPLWFSVMLQSELFFHLLPLSVSTVSVWGLYSKILSHLTHLAALSWSSSTQTHSYYITPFFYVMTAAALGLDLPSLIFLPHTLTVLPG